MSARSDSETIRPDDPLRPVAGAAVIALRGDEVLLVQRGRAPARGKWSLPGGSLEPGETARQAAAREAWEETGLRLRVLDVVDVFDAIIPGEGTAPGFHYCVADFLAEPEDPAATPRAADDAAEARWVPFAEVGALDVTPSVPIVITRARWLRDQRRPPWLGVEAGPTVPPADRWVRFFQGSLYAITADRGPGRGHEEVAAAALAGGARMVQLREKQREASELAQIGREVGTMARAAGALFLVNDRIDLAVAAGADGVHLGQTDLPVTVARALLGPEACVGISVESVEQALTAEAAGADYLGVGDIYGTCSKGDAGAPVGLEHLRRICAATRLPVVAIGGITIERIPEVLAAGAASAAVISAVADAPDMEVAARELARRVREASDGVHNGGDEA